MRKRRSKKKYFLVILILVGLATIFGVLVRFGKIRQIVCDCPHYYVTRLNFLIGKSWYFLPSRKELSQAMSSYVEIADLSVTRKFPQTIILRLTTRQPAAVVNGLLVDAGGQALAPATDSGLLILQVDRSLHPGEAVGNETMRAISALAQVQTSLPDIQNASLSGNILEFSVLGAVQVVVDVNSELSDWPEALQQILKSGRIDGKLPRRVDLRFNNPIMTY